MEMKCIFNTCIGKNISILAKVTQVSDVAHGPLVFFCVCQKFSLNSCGSWYVSTLSIQSYHSHFAPNVAERKTPSGERLMFPMMPCVYQKFGLTVDCNHNALAITRQSNTG
jgi:hypothetical protein